MESLDGLLSPEDSIATSQVDHQKSTAILQAWLPVVEFDHEEIVMSGYDEALVTGRTSAGPSPNSDVPETARLAVGDGSLRNSANWVTLDTEGTAQILVSKPLRATFSWGAQNVVHTPDLHPTPLLRTVSSDPGTL